MTSEETPLPSGHAWMAVCALSLAAFIFNTTEFVPVGLLSSIGTSFDMRSEDVGLMLTIYAWVVALASLPLMLATRLQERRRLLGAVFIVFILSHLVSAFAPNFAVLVIGRLGVASAHAIFWSITASLAVRIAPPGRMGQALGLLATGSSLAMVLGIPMGRVIGEQVGWRITFLVIAAIALLVMLVLLRLLPRLSSRNTGSLSSLPVLFKRPALLCVYTFTILGITAHFTAYSYLEPFIQTLTGLDANVTLALLIFGGAGLVGSVLFGWQGMKHPATFLLLAVGIIGVSLFLLETAARHYDELLVLLVVWGTAIMCFSLAMQARVMGLAPDARDVAMALFSSLFNVGIGAGALLGNQVSVHWHLSHIGLVAGIIAMFTLAGCAFSLFRFRNDFRQGIDQMRGVGVTVH
ncbi:MAG: sugar transporter [Lautropia sp.]|nr:sugar transporter [Lautropia sp.]